MKLPSSLGKIKAGSLPPAFYGELEDFLSSVHPDFAISGRTSLLTLCKRLQKAKMEKISAKRVKDAERMIRAICAAADVRRTQFAKTAEPETAASGRKTGKFGNKAEPLELRIVLGPELKEKFRGIGVSDEKAMERVISFLGEEEFLRRQKFILEVLPERAYRPFFSRIPDFLQTSGFYEGVDMMSLKVKLIDQMSAKAPGLDYARNPEVLLLNFSQMNEMLRIVRRVDGAALRRLSDPEELRKFVEVLGFRIRPGAEGFMCVRQDKEGRRWTAEIAQGREYGPAELSKFFMMAGISGRDMVRAGIVG